MEEGEEARGTGSWKNAESASAEVGSWLLLAPPAAGRGKGKGKAKAGSAAAPPAKRQRAAAAPSAAQQVAAMSEAERAEMREALAALGM